MKRRDVFKRLPGLPFVAAISSAEEINTRSFDVVVVRFKDYLSKQSLQRVRLDLSAVFPGKRIVVLENDAEIEFR